MNNADFWASVRSIITAGFTPEGLHKLDSYAEQFISGKLVYQRFSPQEQHGCSAGGATNVIASLLAGAEVGADSQNQGTLSDYQRECQLGAQQEVVISSQSVSIISSNPSSPLTGFHFTTPIFLKQGSLCLVLAVISVANSRLSLALY